MKYFIVEDFAELLQKPVELTKWVPNTASDGCQRCKKVFGLLRRRHHCRYCGFLVCNQCSQARVVFQEEQSVPVRVCTRCMVKIVGRIDALYNRRYMRAAIIGHTSPAPLTPPGIASPISLLIESAAGEVEGSGGGGQETTTTAFPKMFNFKLDSDSPLKPPQSGLTRSTSNPEDLKQTGDVLSGATVTLQSAEAIKDDIHEVVRRLTTVQSIDELELEQKEEAEERNLTDIHADIQGAEEISDNDSAISTESSSSYIKTVKAQGPWPCVSCSFLNSGSMLDACEACGTSSNRKYAPTESLPVTDNTLKRPPLKTQRSVEL